MADNLEAIRSFYGALARGEAPTALALLAPEVRWTEAEGFPYAGTYAGPDGVLKGVLMRLATEWEGFSATPQEFVVQGDTVVSLGEYSGKYKMTGRSFSVWNLRNGKVVRFRQYTDTAVVQYALKQ